jgi:hypothetical protein
MKVADDWQVILSVARCNPTDQNVMKIGEEIAIARALSDLAQGLLHVATTDVEVATHARARLHM